ncbi:MAG: hypothetical protein HEP71_30685 [Roseivirga sp.]|nr:hypothetical protein [Roseivirga sp.]
MCRNIGLIFNGNKPFRTNREGAEKEAREERLIIKVTVCLYPYGLTPLTGMTTVVDGAGFQKLFGFFSTNEGNLLSFLE